MTIKTNPGRNKNTLAMLIAAGATTGLCWLGNALGAPVEYQYSTATNPYGGASWIAENFLSSSFVSGSFIYDSSAPQTNTANTGAYIYSSYDAGSGVLSSSFTGLNGTVQGQNFSDPRGRTRVASTEFTTEPEDFLTLQAEPTLYTNLNGFSIAGYTVVNVRLFWLETTIGNGNFLANNSLPAVLPALRGRLALDFVQTGTTPSTPDFNNTVFFDGLTVTAAVPEPETHAMMLVGVGLVGWQFRRKSLRAAARRFA